MSNVSTPIKAFTPRKKIESNNLDQLRSKIVSESSNLYKIPSLKSNQLPLKTPSFPKNELNNGLQKNQGVPSYIKNGHNGQQSQNSSIAIEWEHPDLIKIEKRIINKELETKKTVLNILLLLSLKLIFNFINLIWIKLIDPSISYEFEFLNYSNKLLFFLQIICFINIIYGLYKIFKPQDQFTDLNLTPNQRELLGLNQIPTTITKSQQQQAQPQTQASQSIQSDLKTKKSNTPIASPMSSPSKQFSPKKPTSSIPTTATTTTTGTAQNNKIQSLKDISTPTYIPSPKYYYRMDSPSRSRRRNV
ncbi:Nucleoporin [Wickerhamomyces ciferrii]|uniref:Nucleoporin n=1 Tax=Wickerhamomyces ciferrii (strain ATCC 14091 / BCRC 22168 / CBS 111 / JCM 3599 / NBRC 0793 / NRRL Y-1031 F-60-10) TaxID=1206466 RepID=K0KDE7_WICCF|nr:Nucleoporin [Wickerhamomyces ciferrii]CCH43135.1 Nucleoporin [Wickerhamomyces ciferrii]